MDPSNKRDTLLMITDKRTICILIHDIDYKDCGLILVVDNPVVIVLDWWWVYHLSLSFGFILSCMKTRTKIKKTNKLNQLKSAYIINYGIHMKNLKFFITKSTFRSKMFVNLWEKYNYLLLSAHHPHLRYMATHI